MSKETSGAKATATDKKEQPFTFETMAVVLCCMLESGVNLGSKHYKMMSAIDGARGEAAFQHQFRKVKARAKELHEKSSNGDGATPAAKGKAKASKAGTPTSGKKRGNKSKAELSFEDQNDYEERAEVTGSEDESPSKKIKQENAHAVDHEDDEYV